LKQIKEMKINYSPGVFTTSRVFVLTISLTFVLSSLSAQEYKSLYLEKKYKLGNELSEISGITYSGGKIYAVNDSGNPKEVYVLKDSDFDLVSSTRISGAKNIDWEEISSFNDTLYIGDFGNNYGSREGLKIYKIYSGSIFSRESEPGIIKFSYELQGTPGRVLYKKHPWDCEAMVVNSKGIWLFSKDWENRICRLYSIKNQSGSETSIRAIDSINLKHLVTGAFFDENGSKLYLCGYEGNDAYLTIMQSDVNIRFSDEYTTFIIPELKYTQVESVFVKENVVYLASERSGIAQAVYKILLPNK
jgi:hypothetical protein